MELFQAECLEVLRSKSENTYDSLITDPPAGISFMGKDWDKGDGFIEGMTEIFKEVLRVLKPGAHGLVWALPRTSHWTATTLESVIVHIFGSGFPKSLNISKALEKPFGAAEKWSGFGTALKPANEHWILGFDFVGIEREKEYFEIAEKRIGAEECRL